MRGTEGAVAAIDFKSEGTRTRGIVFTVNINLFKDQLCDVTKLELFNTKHQLFNNKKGISFLTPFYISSSQIVLSAVLGEEVAIYFTESMYWISSQTFAE